MNERNHNKSADSLPSEAALVAGYGLDIRLSHWGVAWCVAGAVLVVIALLNWMTPAEFEGLLNALKGL